MRPAAGDKAKMLVLALALTSHQSLATRHAFASGEDAFQFLKVGVGARREALGGAVAAAPAGAADALDNPAAWARVRGRELSLQYAAPFEDVSFSAVGYGHQGRKGTWGFQARRMEYAGLVGHDNFGSPTGDVAAGDLLLGAGYGREWGPNLAVGASLQQARSAIAGQSASVLLGDAGFLYQRPAARLSFGGAVRNLGGKASFLSERVGAPRVLEAGAAWRAWSESLLVSVQAGKASDGDWAPSAGAELWVQNTLALRAGFRDGRDLGPGFSLGLGLRLRDMALDYAFAGNGSGVQASHRVGLSFRFGAPAEALYDQGLALLQAGRHAEALLKFKAALDQNPGHRGAERGFLEAMRRLEREEGAAP